MDFVWGAGQTPIDADEKAGLIPPIETMGELNELEAANIADGMAWLERARRVDPLSAQFLCTLHKNMFGQVWRWAGTYRRSDKNLGGPWHEVPVKTEELVRNVAEQVTRKAYPADELAARYSHGLVFIHPFPNGNGRHSRVAADLLLTRSLGQEPFTWGANGAGSIEEKRARYIEALRAADARDIRPLLAFVRS